MLITVQQRVETVVLKRPVFTQQYTSHYDTTPQSTQQYTSHYDTTPQSIEQQTPPGLRQMSNGQGMKLTRLTL